MKSIAESDTGLEDAVPLQQMLSPFMFFSSGLDLYEWVLLRKGFV